MAKLEVALITGAESGFGLLTSIELALRGFRVFASMRDLARGARLDEEARAANVTIEKIALDVSRPQSIDAAVREVQARAGRIDVLVNNAGFGMGGFVEELDLSELREHFETNFIGLVAVTKAVLPGMRERASGRIINISSISGRFAAPGLGAYSASKFAVEGFSESLRHELSPHGVWVSLIEPGTFRTDIFERNRRVAKRALDPASPNFERSKRFEQFITRMVERSTADPRAVARLITRVAEARRPRLRYLIGTDARGQALAKGLLPFGVLERGMARVLR
jgi:NAD(P)-dependent dehydrogenase (short-subunit alcohol dehydrogenase family)